jgi:hypothetical protein
MDRATCVTVAHSDTVVDQLLGVENRKAEKSGCALTRESRKQYSILLVRHISRIDNSEHMVACLDIALVDIASSSISRV